MDDNDIKSTNKLLRVIVALLLRQKNKETYTLRDQIKILSELGIKPVEIAEILGKTNSYINKELSGLRKNQKQGA